MEKWKKVSNASLLKKKKQKKTFSQSCLLDLLLYRQQLQQHRHDFMLTLAFVFLYCRSSTVRISY